MIQEILGFIVKMVDKIPFLKGYRTVIILAALLVLAVLDVLGVGPGNLYESYNEILLGVSVVTALAHDNG